MADFLNSHQEKSVKKAIERGQIRLDGDETSTGFWLKGGETIEVFKLKLKPPGTYRLKLEIVHEDEHLAVILKPAGLLTSGNTFKTVYNALSFNLEPSKEIDVLDWPLPVHRLDKATSGLLIIAKTKTTRMLLGQQFENNEILKTYHAVVLGKLEESGQFDQNIDGKTALTYYQSLKVVPSLKSENLTLVKLNPKTGRTHQLRKHLSESGHAILGDPIYSPENLMLKHKGLFLSATSISFIHPTEKDKITLETPMPQKFKKRLESEEARWSRRN